jgi:alpha-ketoglutarate-dependent taurine dioxygenase
MRLNTPSGSLNKFLATNQKTGTTYPKVNGQRDPNNVDHWRWNYTYKLQTPSGSITKSVSVHRKLIPQVIAAISAGDSIESILCLLGN